MTTMETEQTESQNGEGWKPPYTSFTTLQNTIKRMHEEGGVPSRLDGSYLSNMPGGTRYTFVASLKALQLITDDAKPTPTLTELVDASEERQKEIWSDLMVKFFGDVLALPKNATQAELETVFKSYGISGSTLRKAVGFYLAATRFAGLTVSRHFKLPKPAPGEVQKGRARKAGQGREEEEPPPPPPPPPDPGSEATKGLDPFILGLVQSLPKPGSEFPQEMQTAWVETARGIFKLIYKTGSDSTEARREASATEGADDN